MADPTEAFVKLRELIAAAQEHANANNLGMFCVICQDTKSMGESGIGGDDCYSGWRDQLIWMGFQAERFVVEVAKPAQESLRKETGMHFIMPEIQA